MNLFNYLREYQKQWGEPDQRYQTIENLIDDLYKTILVDEIQPRLEAQRLVQLFMNHYIDIDQSAKYQYAVFAAIQHVTDNTTPLLSPDQIVFNMSVVSELEKKIK